jgi:hypothetical protein
MKTAIEILTELLHVRPIPSVRVSVARRRSYWGVVRYEIRLDRNGRPINWPLGAADGERRQVHLADKDAEALAERERRVVCQTIGALNEHDARSVLRQWSRLYPKKAATRAAATQLRSIPRWTDRCLVGSGLGVLYARAYGALTKKEISAAEATERGNSTAGRPNQRGPQRVRGAGLLSSVSGRGLLSSVSASVLFFVLTSTYHRNILLM